MAVSRIGKKPVSLPSGVKVSVASDHVLVEGPKGKLRQALVAGVRLQVEKDKVVFERESEDRQTRANHGLMRAMVNNMVQGVHQGYMRQLEISGVGYRAELNGQKLQVFLGFTHPVVFDVPAGIEVAIEKQTKITVKGIDRQAVGLLAARIRATKIADPFKAKGVTYAGERIRRKAGKKAIS
jgi:large subunit ribosomal protein L6